MSLVAEFSVPTGDFALDSALDAMPEMRIEVERLATHSREWVMPFVWATGGDLDDFESAMADDETVADVETLDRFEDGALYLVEWSETVESLVDEMIDRHAVVQEAAADDEWFFKLRFSEEQHLSSFRDHFGSNFELHRKYRASEPRHGEFGLTSEQRETLVVASELGYFAVPRSATVEDIAAELDISANSVSQRLRRAHDALVCNTLRIDGRDRPA
ncbi:helix-turn-helix domain-containing protein [Halorussus gelatinilyticus]|uniref:Helix-turn-helix domain-containing protein n=1 Tax=Halorussus gelatinilyticus TaxID=2937524 RepID=A0A8U0ILB1_9EURY|nr:helix-turn-helix domain-containing protein [Halorussus gelatinilyticus]UPW01122.1 helix-turn-helix domain-containing protein [Halorussus gelatinilyticus]